MTPSNSKIVGLLPRLPVLLAMFAFGGCGWDADDQASELELRNAPVKSTTDSGYNLLLAEELRFVTAQPGASVEDGRARFGIADDLETSAPDGALFEGFSEAAGHDIESNGRTCFSCHRGQPDGFGLPVPPLSGSIPLTDPLFTGIDADAGGDPDAMTNLDDFGLFKYRPNRFDARLDPDAPFRQVFGWRKSPKLHNIGLQSGFLTDLRVRTPSEAARGAAMNHTQLDDDAFPDLISSQDTDDIEAFLLTLFSDPTLAVLRDPNNPLFDELSEDPYSAVAIVTQAQDRGRKVFDQYCFGCHDTPNVFGGLANVDPLADGARQSSAFSWAPAIGRAYNIGVSEANTKTHRLRFTQDLGGGQYAPIVLPLAHEDGTVEDYEVEFDIGLAMTTGRMVDIGRFKVPQLRKLADNAPYFHDNSVASIEAVVDYFNSDAYNNSADGQRFPIRLSDKQRADLIEFLQIL